MRREKSEGARQHTLVDEPLDGDVGVHAAVAEGGVDLALRAVGQDPLEALHHLPGGGRYRRRIRPVRRRVGLPPAAATAATPHGAPAAAAATTSAASFSPSSSIRGSDELRSRRRCAWCGSSKTLVAAALLPHAPCIAAATHAGRKRGPARAGAHLINGGWLRVSFREFFAKKNGIASVGRRRVAGLWLHILMEGLMLAAPDSHRPRFTSP